MSRSALQKILNACGPCSSIKIPRFGLGLFKWPPRVDEGPNWETLTQKQELQTSGISSKVINKTLLHKPDN